MNNFLSDLFWTSVIKSDGCWHYKSVKRGGYVRLYIFGFYTLAHRLAWLITYGPIADGLFVCHRCDNPRCVRPGHLFLGTQQENIADMIKKGRGRAPWMKNSKKTHCPQGHEYSVENTAFLTSGSRVCRVCRDAQNKRKNERRALKQGYQSPKDQRVEMPEQMH